KCFCDYWFLFDCLLVVISLFGQIFAAVATVPSIIQQVLVLRALRLLRLIRALRMIRQMRTIWRLVFGLLTSCDTMISTLALLVLVLYIFAVLGVEMIANDETLREDAGTKAIIELNFSGIFVTMMTLSQFVTMDSIASIYFPLINKKGSLSIYFTLLVITVSIALMNLVTAVLVEGALEHARQEKEEEVKLGNEQVKAMIPQLRDIFTKLDRDGNQEIHLKEIQQAERDGKVKVPDNILDKASVQSMTELFSMLDVDKSGHLNCEEFIDGCLNIFLLDIPLRDLMMLKMIRLLRNGVHDIERDISDMKRVLVETSNSQYQAQTGAPELTLEDSRRFRRCGEVWVRHGDVTLTECNGIVVSFPSVVLITSILSFATLAGLMWLSGHLLNTDMCRLGSELSRMLLVFVAIKVIFLGFHATFLALTWSSVFSHRAFSLVILILDLVLVVLAAVTWRKVLKIQDTIVATLEQEKENTRIEGLARLPQTSFLELQEVAEDAELAVTRMPRCPMHEQCVICLSDFEPSSKVTRLACGHVFHASCINIWLLDAKHKWCPYRCPEEPLRFEDV
ncbi:unnamed protein product, partial [Effrenium voratum]